MNAQSDQSGSARVATLRKRLMNLGGYERQPAAMYPTFYVKRDDVLSLLDEVFGTEPASDDKDASHER